MSFFGSQRVVPRPVGVLVGRREAVSKVAIDDVIVLVIYDVFFFFWAIVFDDHCVANPRQFLFGGNHKQPV